MKIFVDNDDDDDDETDVKRLEKRVNDVRSSNHMNSLTLDGAAYYIPKHLTLKFTLQWTIHTHT